MSFLEQIPTEEGPQKNRTHSYIPQVHQVYPSNVDLKRVMAEWRHSFSTTHYSLLQTFVRWLLYQIAHTSPDVHLAFNVMCRWQIA